MPTKPDFSGLWQLNLTRSTFRGPAPMDILVKIEHREPRLIQTMVIVTAGGEEQRLTFAYDIGGGETTNAPASGEVRSRAHWNGAELVIDSVLSTPNRTFHFSDHWSLSPDGETLQMAHPDDDLAGQVAICERASPDMTARLVPR